MYKRAINRDIPEEGDTSVTVLVSNENLRKMMEITGAASPSSAILNMLGNALWMFDRMAEGIRTSQSLGSAVSPSVCDAKPKPQPDDAKPHITRKEYDTWVNDRSFLCGCGKVTQELAQRFWEFVVDCNFENSKGETITKCNVGKTYYNWNAVRLREERESNARIARIVHGTAEDEEARFRWNKEMLREAEED